MNTIKRKSLNSNVDLINGPIFKSLIIFALPLFISNIFQQLYNTVDTMIVGNFLGDASLAAIGSCTSIYDLLVGFALGIGNGLAIVTARSYGSKDENLLKKSVASSLVIGIVVSISLTIIGLIFLNSLLHLLNTPTKIINEAYSYIFFIVLFIIVMFAYNLCAGLMRAIGNSVMPLVFLIVSSVLNIVLDLLFITQLHMGIQGAAVATVISQGVSVILCIIYMFKKTPLLLPKKEHFKYDQELYKELLGQGFSMGFMSCIVSAGSVILQYGINNLGYLIIAGHTAARKLYMFFNMPFTAMALAISTFVSQNKGANQKDRIKKALRYAYIYDIVGAAIVTVLILLFGSSLVKMISGSSQEVVLHNGTLYLTIVAPFYAILGILMQTRYALQGIGQKLLPLVSSIIEFVGKIIFVFIFIPRFQYMAVIFCEPVIWCVMTIQLVYSFYHNAYIRN
ncbi:MATE family efflux transporter [Erysipelatoclostridium sp. AM42-17]|uniref:MATE family efflux transporter n=1 Tax=Erysipelatoclostridium sp. AM42-17 TaxID=2293102 RepID=UPI000E549FE7|nr:MATE family efflux transporter [Erysipelatoclostridium sp. AM42-17]RHS94689.1 MATE family efflux transporter [Erysipelatoclostridium sp. AM42-17]